MSKLNDQLAHRSAAAQSPNWQARLFDIRRMANSHRDAQQAIQPQAVALALLGGLIALALLVLGGQGPAAPAAHPVGRGRGYLAGHGSDPDRDGLTLAVPGAVAILGSVVLALGGAFALSPLAPVELMRIYDPQTGARADWLVLGGGAAAMLLLLGGMLAWLAWQAAGARPTLARPGPRADVSVPPADSMKPAC